MKSSLMNRSVSSLQTIFDSNHFNRLFADLSGWRSCTLPTAIPMFSWSINSMKLYSILGGASGKQEFKMTTHKQQILMLFVRRHHGFLFSACITQYREDNIN